MTYYRYLYFLAQTYTVPVIKSSYRAPLLYQRHLSTIYMGRLRRAPQPDYERQRIDFDEDDFLDLDWLRADCKKLLVVCHGLSGSSDSHAVRSLSQYFHDYSWDVVALNMRGCSGEPNRKLRHYHMGASDQLDFVLDNALSLQKYDSVYLLGISMGGNIVLKYLGEKGEQVPSTVKRSVAVSVPCHIASCAKAMSRRENFLYLNDILGSLKQMITLKAEQFPELVDIKGLKSIRDIEKFDSLYTAPIHGFESEQEYYKYASSLFYLKSVARPVLLLSALDDPFLTPQCFPFEIANESEYLFLETPTHGGHVAFPGAKGENWLGQRVKEFLEEG